MARGGTLNGMLGSEKSYSRNFPGFYGRQLVLFTLVDRAVSTEEGTDFRGEK